MSNLNIFNVPNNVNQYNVTQGDFLNAKLLDFTLSRFDSTIYGRTTLYGATLGVDGTTRVISPTSSTVNRAITFPASVVTLRVASTSASDTSAGVGARTVLITGLDSNYDSQTDTLSLNGTTPVNSTKQFLRITDIAVVTAGTSLFNVGNIYVSDSADTFTAGVPDNRLYFAMDIGENIGKTAVYTVPRGFNLVPERIHINTTATGSNPIVVQIVNQNRKISGNTYAIKDRFYISGFAELDLSPSPFISEKSDIFLNAYKTGGGANPSVHIKIFAILKKIQKK